MHFKLDDCRVWMRLHFWAAREAGLFEGEKAAFGDYYVRFIAHFVRVYEASVRALRSTQTISSSLVPLIVVLVRAGTTVRARVNALVRRSRQRCALPARSGLPRQDARRAWGGRP